MQNSGVTSGLSVHRADILLPADRARIGNADALDALSGATRVGRDTGAAFPQNPERTRRESAPIPMSPAARRGDGPDLRQGAPSSAYLAQHIAQEVAPEDPGFDAYRAGARAYIFRRDSTVEILSGASRLDVFV